MLLNALLSLGVDPEKVDSKHFQLLLKDLKKSYNSPNATALKEEIFEDAFISLENERAISEVLPCLIIHREIFDFTEFLVALALTTNGKYVFVDDCEIVKDTEYIQSVENFCDKALLLTSKEFKNKITTVILDFDIEVSTPGTVKINDSVYKYLRVKSVKVTLEALLKFDYHYENGTSLLLTEYENKLTEMINKFETEAVSYGEAIELIFSSIDDDVFSINPQAKETVLQSFNSFAWGCNKLNHRFDGKIFETAFSIEILNKFKFQFIGIGIPTNVRKNFSDYDNKVDQFSYLFNCPEDYNNDPKNFWENALGQYKDFAEFGLQILKIPAIPRKINIKHLHEMFENLKLKNKMLYLYTISLHINEN